MEGISGLVANFSSTILSYPIDVIKTKYQVNTLKNNNQNVPSIIKDIYKNTGFKGFFRGIVPQLTTYPIFWSIYFQTKGMNNYKLTDNHFINKVAISYMSASIASAATNPLFVMKIRMQTYEIKPTIPTVVNTIYKENGIRGLFKGLPATMINNLKLGIQFPMYDIMKSDYGYNSFTASIISKLTTTSIFYPLDLIRVNQRNSSSNLSMVDATKTIYKQHGISGFYRGVMLYNFVSTPSFVIMVLIKDIIDANMIKWVDK